MTLQVFSALSRKKMGMGSAVKEVESHAWSTWARVIRREVEVVHPTPKLLDTLGIQGQNSPDYGMSGNGRRFDGAIPPAGEFLVHPSNPHYRRSRVPIAAGSTCGWGPLKLRILLLTPAVISYHVPSNDSMFSGVCDTELSQVPFIARATGVCVRKVVE